MILRQQDAGDAGGGKPLREQRILLSVEAPAGQLKAPDSGLNIALAQLGRMETRLKRIDALWTKLSKMPFAGGMAVSRGGVGSASVPQVSVPASGRIISATKNETTGATDLVTALNEAETLLQRVRTNAKGSTEVIKIDKQQLDRATKLSEEMSKHKASLSEQLAIAGKITNEQDKLLAEAKAYHDFRNKIERSTSTKTPAQAASWEREAAGAKLAEVRRHEAAMSEMESRRRANEERGIKGWAEQEKEANKGIIDERARRRTEAENNALRAQTAAFNAQMASPKGNLRVAKAQGAVAYQQQMVGFHKTSGDMGALLQHTNSLSVANATLAHTTAQVNQQYSHIGRNLVQNVAHVSAWAAAVGALYGSLRLLSYGASSVIELEYAQARLSQVFRHGPEQVARLTDGILQLAAANGRTSKEAMDSAIQWSRLNLNRVEVTEAVRVSLMGANVAEMSAAESTEHLASLYQVFGLRVSELNGVLGMLNQTSNTFNVTNKSMLEGITRVSAAAKQAGLGLAELIGLQAAGAGATGQTGPNIGNALKSFIGSVTSGDKQKLLRDQFKFEVTVAGTDQVKNMSELLAELFVAFQHMTQAERQSLIFNVAGKNQASRMTAILDNYIRAQTLAINAQLNLNSAENENNAIRATAKAHLQGLITEFERFSYGVATFGKNEVTGIAMFSEVILAMKNALAALNGGPGAMTVALMAAIAAKSLVMMTQMGAAGKSAGVLRNTMGGVVNALREVSQALIQGIGLWSRVPGPVGKAAAAWGGVARSTHGSSMAFKALGVGIGLAAVELAALAGLIYGLSMAWNSFSNFIGLSSDKADEAMQKMVQRAEAAKGAAEAAVMQAKLYKTMQDALAANPSKTGRAGLIDNLMNGVPEDRRDALRKKLDDANKEADATKRNAMFKKALEKEVAEAEGRAATERARHYRIDLDNVRALESEIRKLENSMSGRQGWNKNDIEKKKQELGALKNRGVARILEDNENQEESSRRYRETNQGHLTFLEKQKAVLESIKDLYSEIPGDTHLDRAQKTAMALKQQEMILRAQLEIANQRRAAMGGNEADSAELVAGPAEERAKRIIRALTNQIEGDYNARLAAQGSGLHANRNLKDIVGYDPFAEGAAPVGYTHGISEQQREQLNRAQAEINRLMEQARSSQSTVSSVRSNPEFQRWDAQATAVRQEIERVQLEQSRRDDAAARLRDRMGTINTVTGGFIQASAVGNNETERLSNQLEYNRAAIAAHQTQVDGLRLEEQWAETADGRKNILQQIAEINLAQANHMKAAAEEEQQLLIRNEQIKHQGRQEEKNFRQAMMFDSPGNILKRMAMDKLTKGGRDMRGFMGFDEAGRGMMRPLVENRMEAAENAAALNRIGVRPGQNGVRDLIGNREQEEPWAKRIKEGIETGMQPMFNAAATASIEIGRLNSAAGAAATTLTQFEAALKRVLSERPPPGPPAATNPQGN